ncbi:MAG TPA: M56 family metallopeptidase [Gemmatimonadales bacterium]|nr:M56 family metallopeptidase [Gemmatimonadales bacterium]
MIDLSASATVASRWLAHSLWQGAVVMLVYLVVGRIARRDGAETECRSATVGMMLISILPFLTAGAAWLAGGVAAELQASPVDALTRAEIPGKVLRLMQQQLTFDVAQWVVGVWLAGAVLSLAYLLASLWWLNRRIMTESRAVELPGLRRLASRVGLEGAPAVRAWSGAKSPFVTGWLRPIMVVPVGLHRLLGESEAESVLLHELAHVARKDVARNLLLRVLGALAWYQLPFWVLLRDLNRARERACDDLAVRAMGRGLPLARALVLLEEQRAARPRLAMAGTGGDFSSRVRRILASSATAGPARHRVGSAVILAVLLFANGGTLLLAASAEGSLRRWAGSVHALISANDPAGPFTVELMGSRLVGATIDGRVLPAERIVQQGSQVALLNADGRPELTLRVEAPGAIHWTPRAPRSP